METYRTATGEEYVLCLVCNQPCFGGYASHIPCGGVKITELEKLRKGPFFENN